MLLLPIQEATVNWMQWGRKRRVVNKN